MRNNNERLFFLGVWGIRLSVESGKRHYYLQTFLYGHFGFCFVNFQIFRQDGQKTMNMKKIMDNNKYG